MSAPQLSVIISTYNAVDWLEKVLWGYSVQEFTHFELLVADDGSTEKTAQLIADFRERVDFPVHHIWQEDEGFQKSRILNKAIMAANSPYLVMSDGDCIPRKDFLKVHFDRRKKGYFLSGGYFMLPMDISKCITKEDIITGNCFDVDWLKRKGLKPSFKNNKLTAGKIKAGLLNLITPTNASWNGHNASGWKEDIIGVNGFDERMQYGGQDRELGERLINSGIKSKQIRYSAICIHLDHPRGYKNEASIQKNRAIRKKTRDERRQWTSYGIKKEER